MLKTLILATQLVITNGIPCQTPVVNQPVEINPSTFKGEVLGHDVVLLEFYTSWCPYCKMMEPILGEVAAKHPELHIVKFNAEKYPVQNVNSFPTMVLVVKGQIKLTIPGALPKEELLKAIKPYLPQGA